MKIQNILLVESIHPAAKQNLENEGFQVDLLPHAPSHEELLKILPKYQAVGIRSKTQLSAEVFTANPQLHLVGCFCIGTNQVDLRAAMKMGVPVFNAPHSNTRSVAELVISEMVALSRQIGDRNTMAHKGEWLKSAVGSKEVRGKTVGIVGYGHIGSQVSILAEAMGMKVLFYDVLKKLPLGNAMSVASLKELLANSDFVTLHVPETLETKDMISKKELMQMKKGSYLLNLSRGTVIVIDDLADALKSGHLAGCAVDVFPEEPASNKEKFLSPLQGLANVILTPHIGGSTEEAQYAIGLEVAESFRKFIKIGTSSGAVNFPNVDLPKKQGVSRVLNVHENKPGMLGEINGIISKSGANIEAQFLSTDADIGYLVMDISTDKQTMDRVVSEVKSIGKSIRTRSIND